MILGYGSVTPTREANALASSYLFWVQLALTSPIIVVTKHGIYCDIVREKNIPTQAITCTLTQWGTAALPR